MRRRDLLSLAAGPLLGQQRIFYRDYSRCLPDYLRGLAEESYQRRNRALAGLTTPEQIRRRQAWVRETFWKLTGGEPERTPLNARVTGEFERDAYLVRKVIYESRPGFHIPANLYIPKTGGPRYPGVLFQMGHAQNGKAASFYQYCCQGLAQLGYVVLAFDPMGQGERTYYPGANGLTRLGSADEEHTVPGKQLLLTGDTSTRLQTWDAVRSLDYLASLPMVDAARLGSTGNSGGGTLTMMLAAVDERLACAVPACPNTENHACANFNPPGSTDDAEQNFINGGPHGFDRWDTLYPLAPKPMLVIVSAKDFYGTYSPRYIENGREEFEKLKKIYSVLGKPDRLEWHETPLPHGLSYDVRMATYNWFHRWLQPGAQEVKQEPPVKAEPDENLWVTESGNVVRSLDSLTPRQMAAGRARSITTPAKPQDLEKLLALDPPGKAAGVLLGRAASRHAEVDALEVRSASNVWIPYWLFHPRRPQTGAPMLILLEPAGRNARWNEDSLCQQLAERGITVCTPELRGIGDVAPEFPRHAPRHGRSHQEEEHYAWASLMLGKPLLGQRVTDLLAVAGALPRGRRIVAAATGKMTVPALFAAAISTEIAAVHIHQGLPSFRSLVEMEDYSHPFANFVPDLLRHADLPQLAESLGSRCATLATWDLASLSRL
jgi:dienelactone hydrolase